MPRKKRRTSKKVVEPKKLGRPRLNYEFLEARELVRGECISSVVQYEKWWILNTPARMPKRPDRAYKHQWVSWKDFLGSSNPFPFVKRPFRTFVNAKSFVHQLGLTTKSDWFDFVRTGEKPTDIPTRPDLKYRKEWFTWRDWLGADIPSVKRNLAAAGAVFFIIHNSGRPNNVYQLGITAEGKETIIQYQVRNRFHIIGIFHCDIEFNWKGYALIHGKPYWESNRRDEYAISNINEFIFDIGEFVERATI